MNPFLFHSEEYDLAAEGLPMAKLTDDEYLRMRCEMSTRRAPKANRTMAVILVLAFVAIFIGSGLLVNSFFGM